MTQKKSSSFLKITLLLLFVLLFGGAGAFAVNHFCLELGGQCMYRPKENSNQTSNIVREVKEISYVEESSLISALEKSKPAVVLVEAESSALLASSFGSGLLLTNDGLVLTNKHVAPAEQSYAITLSDNSTYSAKLVAQDNLLDLAFLQIQNLEMNLPIAELGDSDLVKQGQRVFSLGYTNPRSSVSIRSGILSDLNSSALALNQEGALEYISNSLKTDYSLEPGFSGGPLVNLNGQVIGLSVAESSGGITIPITDLKPLLQSYLETKKISRPFLGVKTISLTPENATEFETQVTRGELVQEIIPNSPAALASLQAGDILLSLNDTDLTSAAPLQKLLWQNLPNSEINLKILRTDKEQTFKIKLSELTLPLIPQTF